MQKDVSQPFQNFPGVAMTGTTPIYSPATNILYKDTVNIQLEWTGSPSGTFQIQGCNDYKPALTQSIGFGAPNPGTWSTIPVQDPVSGTTYTTIPTSAGSPISVNMVQLGYAWLQVVYTNATGSGVLTGLITAKSLG